MRSKALQFIAGMFFGPHTATLLCPVNRISVIDVVWSFIVLIPSHLLLLCLSFDFTDEQDIEEVPAPDDHVLQGVELMELAFGMGVTCSKMHEQTTEAKLTVKAAQNMIYKCARGIMGEEDLRMWELEWQSKTGVDVLGPDWNTYVGIWAEVSKGEFIPRTRAPKVGAQTSSMVRDSHCSLLIYCLADSVACRFVWEVNSSAGPNDGLAGGDQGDCQGHDQKEGRRGEEEARGGG